MEAKRVRVILSMLRSSVTIIPFFNIHGIPCSFGHSPTVSEDTMTLRDKAPYVDVRRYSAWSLTCTAKLHDIVLTIYMHVYTLTITLLIL